MVSKKDKRLANQNRIEEALQSQQPEIELETVVRILSEERLTRIKIYEFFLDYQVANQDKAEWQQIEDRFGDHPVMLILDRLNGWCSPTRALLPEEPFE